MYVQQPSSHLRGKNIQFVEFKSVNGILYGGGGSVFTIKQDRNRIALSSLPLQISESHIVVNKMKNKYFISYINLQQSTFTRFERKYPTFHFPITGNFTCIAIVFNLRRRLGYHLFHTYIPSALIVVMSWISFWIKPEAIPARVTLGVTSLLTLGKFISSYRIWNLK